jgi:mRNA interferase MazF
MSYKQWDIAVIPFPFVESLKTKPRPVLILSQESFASANNHLMATMITSSYHQKWRGDTEITDLEPTGLKKKSIIRLKLFTLDIRLEPKVIGTLGEQDQKAFQAMFTDIIL